MIVDFCAYLGEWPTYELRYRDADGLLRLMDRYAIDAACVSLAGGMFRYDAREANESLCQLAKGHRDRLWLIGTVNPLVPTWREDVQYGVERLGLAGYRIHPTYQGYELTAPSVLELANMLSGVKRPLFIALYVDEERFQHPAIRVPEVHISEIGAFVSQVPDTTIVLNGVTTSQVPELFRINEALDCVYLDIDAMDTDFEGLRTLVERYGVERLVYGSQMPFLYPEAALMVAEYSGLPDKEIEAILSGNWSTSLVLSGLQDKGGILNV
jgi:predicted TIM-barrel fold metal-dependent hydrolase